MSTASTLSYLLCLGSSAAIGYPAPGDKNIFLLPPTKTAEFEVKNTRKTAEKAKSECLLLLLLLVFNNNALSLETCAEKVVTASGNKSVGVWSRQRPTGARYLQLFLKKLTQKAYFGINICIKACFFKYCKVLC